jgi:peptidoglycan glycosyltransferase
MNAPLRKLATVVTVMFAALLISATWIQVVSADALGAKPGNARTLYKEFGRERGPLLVAGAPVAESVPVDDVYAYQRTYADGPLYAPVTGFYSILYGTTWMEDAANDLLAGTADQLFYRRITDLLTGRQPQGASVELTVNPAAQKAAYDTLGDQRGAVVALNPRTGEVLALVSKPSYDPNALAGHSGAEVTAAREALLADSTRPLENRAVAGRLYPPGSVFKLVTAAAALESSDYTPDSMLPGPAELDLPETTVTLPTSGGRSCGPNDMVSLTDALRISCNTAFGYLGIQLGDEALREQAARFGFGQDLSIPIRVTPSSVPAEMNAPQTAQAAIGQYDVRATPLQIAMVSAGIANGGVVMRPNLVKVVRGGEALEVIDRPSPEQLSRAVGEETAREMTQMMIEVVANGTGTRAQIDGVTVAGKTGTAQQGEGQSPHAWFTSFAPAEDPTVAVAVVVEDGGDAGDQASGGRVAAPIAKAVMEAVLGR